MTASGLSNVERMVPVRFHYCCSFLSRPIEWRALILPRFAPQLSGGVGVQDCAGFGFL